MAPKINSFNINVSVAVFLFSLVVGQFYWLADLKAVPYQIALADAFCAYGLLYLTFLFIRYNPVLFVQKYLKYGLIDLIGLVITVIWVYLCRYILLHLFSEEPSYETLWAHTLFIRGFIGWILVCSFIAIHLLSNEFEEYHDIAEQKQTSERLRKEAELFKMRQQLQPHFLFNSLNSVNALIGKRPEDARLMVQQLSDYLRHNMNKEEDGMVSILDEIADLKLYLAIELVRFGHRLKIVESFDINNQNLKMPPFLIQPLVENAIKFGLYGTTGAVEINISTKIVDTMLNFQISNPFDESDVTPKGTGFGLASIRRRLYLLYARNDLLTVSQDMIQDSHIGHYTVTLTIPLRPPVNESPTASQNLEH